MKTQHTNTKEKTNSFFIFLQIHQLDARAKYNNVKWKQFSLVFLCKFVCNLSLFNVYKHNTYLPTKESITTIYNYCLSMLKTEL